MEGADAFERYLDTLFTLSEGGRRGVSPVDIFDAARLPEAPYSPRFIAKLAAALGYADHVDGKLALTHAGMTYCESIRTHRK